MRAARSSYECEFSYPPREGGIIKHARLGLAKEILLLFR